MELFVRMKSGAEFNMICDGCKITRDGFGLITNIRFEGCQNIKPMILDPNSIELMYEVVSAERRDK